MDIKPLTLPVGSYIYTHDGIAKSQDLVALTNLAKGDGDFTKSTRILGLQPDLIAPKPCVKIHTKDGQAVVLPEDAQVYLHHKSKKVQAKEIQEGDEVSVFLADSDENCEQHDWERFEQERGRHLGFLAGDGTLRKMRYVSKKTGIERVTVQYVLYFCQKNSDLEGCLSQKLINQPQFHDPQAVKLAKQLGDVAIRTYQQNPRKNSDGTVKFWMSRVTTVFIPKNYFERDFFEKGEIYDYMMQSKSIGRIKGFISGLFGADSTVNFSTKNLRLSQSNLPALIAVKLMLQRLGIYSHIRLNGKTQKSFYEWTERDESTGENIVVRTGKRKTSYILQVCGSDLKGFVEKCGVFDAQKAQELSDMISSRKRFSAIPATALVQKVEFLEYPCIPVMVAKGDMDLTQLSLDGIKVFM